MTHLRQGFGGQSRVLLSPRGLAGGPGQRKERVGSVSSLRLVLAQRRHGLIGVLASTFEEVSEPRGLYVGDSVYRRIGKIRNQSPH